MTGRSDPAKIALIGHVALFADCTRRELGHVSRLMDEYEIDEGTILTRQGEPGRDFFVIIEGTADVDVDGERMARLGEGDFFGEMSLLDGGPRSATVTASSPMFVLSLGTEKLEELVTASPSVAVSMLRTLASRIRGLETHHSH